jgi:hypothetical protein
MGRLFSLSSDPIFRRLFEAEETKIHFGEVIDNPKVCVINADRRYLRSLKELYGRYFLGLIKSAGESRPANSIPCFIYVDECDEFVSNDDNTADILLKLRRKKVALTLGNQLVSRIKPLVRQAFLGTAIKFANCDPDSATELAPVMNLLTEGGRPDTASLINRPKMNFSYYIRGWEAPQSFKFEPGTLEAMPQMTNEEWAQVRQENRDRYYIPIKRAVPPAPPTKWTEPYTPKPPRKTPPPIADGPTDDDTY